MPDSFHGAERFETLHHKAREVLDHFGHGRQLVSREVHGEERGWGQR